MLNPFSQSTPNETVAERYELIERLGVNGLMQSFLARELYSPGHRTKRVVERYELPPVDDAQRQEIQQLFQRESEQLAELGDDSQMPRMLAFFETGEAFYRVREWVQGRPLEKMLAASTSLMDEQIVLLVGDLLKGVRQIHQHEVLHLNLQPQNVLCEKETHRLVMVNFGGFQQGCDRILSPISSLDVPPIYELSAYMPNEQIAGHPQPSSDLFAVGMIAIRALDSYPAQIPLIDRNTGEVQWPGFAAMRHPALLMFLQNLVRYDHRDRYQLADEALAALRALPQDLTRLLVLSSIFPESIYPLAGAVADEDAVPETSEDLAESEERGLTKTLVPAGVGVLALMGTGALVWRAAGPTTTVVDEGERTTAVAPDTSAGSIRDEASTGAQGETAGEAVDPEEPVDASAGLRSAEEDSVSVTEIDSGELSSAPTDLSQAEVERIEVEQVERAIASAEQPRRDMGDRRVVELGEPAVLDTNTAKTVIQRFYDRVATRSWGDVRSLLNDRLARSLEPNFFYQFSKVTVDDFYIVRQDQDSIDFIVENTYVYLDGTSQREERSYTVEIVDNQPTITATAFEAVIKDRG